MHGGGLLRGSKTVACRHICRRPRPRRSGRGKAATQRRAGKSSSPLTFSKRSGRMRMSPFATDCMGSADTAEAGESWPGRSDSSLPMEASRALQAAHRPPARPRSAHAAYPACILSPNPAPYQPPPCTAVTQNHPCSACTPTAAKPCPSAGPPASPPGRAWPAAPCAQTTAPAQEAPQSRRRAGCGARASAAGQAAPWQRFGRNVPGVQR